MIWLFPSSPKLLRSWLAQIALATAILVPAALQPASAATAAVSGDQAPTTAATVTLAAYQNRIAALDQLVTKCQQKMTPANCDGDAVGPDVQLAVPGGIRQIRFGWLRGVLADAAKADAIRAQLAEKKKAEEDKAAANKPATSKDATRGSDDDGSDADTDSDAGTGNRQVILMQRIEFPPKPIELRLEEARRRLAAELQSAMAAADESTSEPASNSAQEHEVLARILTAKEYKTTVVNPSLKDRLLEKVARWVNQAIGKLVNAGSKSKWIGTAAEIGFGVALCVTLVWFLIRLEKQGRFTASMIRSGPGSGAASARDWQLWLQDAREAAAKQEWRDAIHLLYWASISRLEGSGLWPADRARTPREYLALVSQESQHRPALGALTRNFERTWYAGRSADEADFHAAEQLAAKLGATSNAGAMR